LVVVEVETVEISEADSDFCYCTWMV